MNDEIVFDEPKTIFEGVVEGEDGEWGLDIRVLTYIADNKPFVELALIDREDKLPVGDTITVNLVECIKVREMLGRAIQSVGENV